MTQDNDHLEIEVKFFLENLQAVRQKLIGSAILIEPRIFETNLRYEDETHTLIKAGKLLRLRRDRGCRLTFKSRSRDHKQRQQFKIHHELEVDVSDYDTMNAILQQIGFQVVQVYEKQRETFALHDALVCLDTMPYGDFLEIEGSENSILKVVDHLGLIWEERILDNYLSIFDLLRKKAGLDFKDVTFENFRNHPVHIGPLLTLLQERNKR